MVEITKELPFRNYPVYWTLNGVRVTNSSMEYLIKIIHNSPIDSMFRMGFMVKAKATLIFAEH